MDLQALFAYALIAVAAAFLGRRLYRSFKGEPDGACSKCAPPARTKKAA
jgi:hypothetical protein